MANIAIKDIEEWLKDEKNAGKVKVPKEGEKLSAYDELYNRSLYQEYLDGAQALQKKNEKDALVDKQTASALRDNYVAQEQAKRQANEAMLASGVQTGLSESSLIDLYARGAAARAGIINSSNTAKNDIFSKYQDAIATSKRETNSSLAQIETERDTYAKANDIDQFANALSIYENDGDFEDLKAAYDKFGGQLDKTENYDLIQKYNKYAEDYDKATIDVTADDFDVSEFGRFFGIDREDSNQHDYLEQIVAATTGKNADGTDYMGERINVGQYIVPNYGKHLDKRSYVYEYLGNGKFKKVELGDIKLGQGFLAKGSQVDRDLDVYTPEGYEFKDGWWNKLWGTSKVKEATPKTIEIAKKIKNENPKLYKLLEQTAAWIEKDKKQ